MPPRTPLTTRVVALGLALAPLASARPSAPVDEETLHHAYYLEREEGDLEGALELYERLAGTPGASEAVRAVALERGGAVREELAASDLARLVPADTIAYLELNDPGGQVSHLLAHLGLLRGVEGAGELAISPRLVDGLLGLGGAAVAITHVDLNGGPPAGVAILHPGDMDVVRGLVETVLPAGGLPVDPIGGHDTYSIEGQAFVTLTDRLVIASLDRGHIEGVLERLAGGGADSLASNPNLAPTLALRGQDLVFACVNAQPLLPQLQALVGQQAARDPEVALAMGMLDIGSLRALAGRLGVDEAGVSLDLGLQLAEDHRNVAFNLLRMPHVSSRTLELVPSGAAFFLATSLNEAASPAPGATNGQGEPVVSLMDIGREVFGNVVDVAVYAMPSTTQVMGQPVPDVALALTVNDPARSRALWSLVLGMTQGISSGSGLRPEVEQVGDAVVERYDIDGADLYVRTEGKRMVVTPSPSVLEAAAGAGAGRSILEDELYREVLGSLSDSPTLALAVSPGRAARLAQPYLSERERRDIAPFLGLLESSVLSLEVEQGTSTLGLSARMDGLPSVGELLGDLVRAELHGSRGRGRIVDAHPELEVALVQRQLEQEVALVQQQAQREVALVRQQAELEAQVRRQELSQTFEAMVLGGHHEAARDLVPAVAEALAGRHLELNNFAWYLLTEERYGARYDDLALPIAQEANELTGHSNWRYLDTLGHALARNGQLPAAVEVQARAVALSLAEEGADTEEAVAALARFEAQLARVQSLGTVSAGGGL